MSAEPVTLILPTLCVPGVGYLWLPFSCYCLERFFGRPVLPLLNLTSHIDDVCAHLHCSIPAAWPPQFHLILWATDTMSFILVYSLFQHSSLCRSLQLSVLQLSSLHLLLRRREFLFSFSLSEDVWASHNVTGSKQDSRNSFFISSFWNIL